MFITDVGYTYKITVKQFLTKKIGIKVGRVREEWLRSFHMLGRVANRGP